MSGGDRKAKADFIASAGPTKDDKPRKRSSVPPVTLRLTPDERERLEELAAGMTLSAYIRACVFAKEERRRKRRPKNAVADKKAMAEALALMGQSRIANNLNQLAHQANIGALDMDEDTCGQIDEAYLFIAEMRGMLVKALRSGA